MDIKAWRLFTIRVILILMLSNIFLGSALAYIIIAKEKSFLLQILNKRKESIAESLGRTAIVPILLEDQPALKTLTQGLIRWDVIYAQIMDLNGNTLSQSQSGEEFVPAGPSDITAVQSMTHRTLQNPQGVPIYEVIFPISPVSQSGKVPSPPLRIGFARVGLSGQQIQSQISSLIKNVTWATTGILVGVFLLAAFFIRKMTVQMMGIIDRLQMAKELELTTDMLNRVNLELEKRVEERTTELRINTEELTRSNAELQQFAYVASHDLQEPLRMVSLYTDLLSMNPVVAQGPETQEHLRFVKEGARRAQQLIIGLLEFSRLGAKDASFTPTSLDEILSQVLVQLDVSIKESGTVITSDSLPVVPVDRLQISQLFQNLISNAIKYRNSRGPEIRITAKKSGGEYVFCFRDNGIGIDPKYHQSIFVIFKRLHTAQEYPGTGIGLALCKKIVEQHGGRIWVESEAGQGAAFYFTLPDREGKA